MGGLSDLSFDPGIKFSALASQRFGCTVSPSEALSSSVFLLVASFGRSAIRLNEDSVSLILQSCLGGSAKDFNVLHLSGWMFCFSVSCKNIEFMVYNLKSFSCKSFSIFFHLWGGGGPNWRKDYALWCKEQEDEWTIVGSKHKKSFDDIVRLPPQIQRQSSVFRRLQYPKNYYQSFIEPQPEFQAKCSTSISKSFEPAPIHRHVLCWVPKQPKETGAPSHPPDSKSHRFALSKPTSLGCDR